MTQSTNPPIHRLPLVGFIGEAYLELKKVTWPGRKQVIRLTTIVLVACIVTGAYLGALDYIFTGLLGFVLNRPEISGSQPLPLPSPVN